MTVGGRPEKASFEPPEPISSVSSSWTILTDFLARREALRHRGAGRALAHAARRSP